MPFILFIFPLIPVILYCIIFYCKEYFNGKANKYSLFKFKDFKQWYNLSPESFIFDNNLYCLYYIHSTNKDASIFTNKGYRKKYWYDDSGMEWHDVIDKTTMYPKTLFDSILYSLFVVKIYRKLKKEEQHKEKIYDNIYANNETIRVMNSLQKNIDKVLKESQTIINIEQSKL
jgi:hypothetical protein